MMLGHYLHVVKKAAAMEQMEDSTTNLWNVQDTIKQLVVGIWSYINFQASNINNLQMMQLGQATYVNIYIYIYI